jgi:hypothetical protein
MIPTSMDQVTPSGTVSAGDTGLDEMFRVYRAACEAPDPGANFMPNIWAGIEAREVSTNWFGRFAKTLVAAALAASTILGVTISSARQSGAFFNSTVVEALRASEASTLEPISLDRLSELDIK